MGTRPDEWVGFCTYCYRGLCSADEFEENGAGEIYCAECWEELDLETWQEDWLEDPEDLVE